MIYIMGDKEKPDMNKFKDSQGYIYYVSSILNSNKYAIHRVLNTHVNIGTHIWMVKENLICDTASKSQMILNKEALKRGWKKYETYTR